MLETQVDQKTPSLTQAAWEASSYVFETRRIPDFYYFVATPEGKLFSPKTGVGIKKQVDRTSLVGQLEGQVFDLIEDWVSDHQQGVIAWVSPPAAGIYPASKIIVSNLDQQSGIKYLYNRAIMLDLDEQDSLQFARDLAQFSEDRPFLSSLDQVRATPLVLKTQGLNWTYLLEELVDNLDLSVIRSSKDIKVKEEALGQIQDYYDQLVTMYGKVDTELLIDHLAMIGAVGENAPSCPVNWTAFAYMSEHSKQYFNCPNKLCGKPIPKGKGVTICPHCGARKEDFQKCD
ncbi:zinc ribbon domain-containing protein [Patescibacteria group bacterium]|nr:zinc ribbon domain-containing protein [Patescibacteria group bacterium]